VLLKREWEKGRSERSEDSAKRKGAIENTQKAEQNFLRESAKSAGNKDCQPSPRLRLTKQDGATRLSDRKTFLIFLTGNLKAAAWSLQTGRSAFLNHKELHCPF
jgi:hypothetical protein